MEKSFDIAEVNIPVRRALELLVIFDKDLLRLNSHEQAITHRFAVYLEKMFPEYNVDCEYNKSMSDVKKINGKAKRPDIIIHRRNTDENFVVIQVKKNDVYCEKKERLKAFTKQDGEYKYQFGYFINLKSNGIEFTMFPNESCWAPQIVSF